MNWIIFVIISAMGVTAATLLEKYSLFHVHATTYATTITALNALFCLILLPFVNFSSITLLGWIFLFFVSIINAAGFLFLTKATRHGEVSYITQLGNISPGLTAIFAFFLLGEALTLTQIMGIIFIMLGAYILHAAKNKNIFHSFSNFLSSNSKHYILFATPLYAFSAIGAKYLLNSGVSPLTFMVLLHITMTLIFFVLQSYKYKGFHDIKSCIQSGGFAVIIASICFFISRIAIIFAISIASVALATGLKRISTLFVTVLGGGIFHEHNRNQRIVAALIIILGVVLIV